MHPVSMETTTQQISRLFETIRSGGDADIKKLPASGSNRVYYRIRWKEESFIATHGINTAENRTFVAFSRHFLAMGSPVPKILAVSDDDAIYIQEDFGDVSLLATLEQQSYSPNVNELFKKSLQSLAFMQIRGDQGLDYNLSLTSKEFGKQAIFSDLLYFKYYFLDTLQIPYDKEALLADFESLGTYLDQVDQKYFMFRDFQSRNIFITGDDVHFIDYQGGMKGALQYDVASLLWQAKAELPDDWKNNLLTYYMSCVEQLLGKPLDRGAFVSQYNGYVLIRLLQVLGAYGFRGLFERKAHFLVSIPLALKNLRWFLENKKIGIDMPEFGRLLGLVIDEATIRRFETVRASDTTPLTVHINSFSFRKAIPSDSGGNGGGFVFDCRGILNPGRIEQFKVLTGRDKPVKDYLEQETRMPDFLNSVYDLVDLSVEDYIKRDFESLLVCFGCTGGQHRSVYAADALARHLKNKFGVKCEVKHVEQEAKGWVNLTY